MKTFMNAIRIIVVTLLFVSLTSLADCCKKACAPKVCAPKCTTGCKLQPEPVKIRKTCDHPGFYKQVCHLEYIPCEGKVEEYTAMPMYKGCFDEQGNVINNGSTEAMGEARVQNVDIQVQVPDTYTQGTNGRRAARRATTK
jgi:hypothetical protein